MSAPSYGPVEACGACGSDALQPVLFLGYLPPVNRMRPIGAPFDAEEWYPAEMLSCPHCHLVQLGYAVAPTILFPPEYPYTSGTTRILRENFADLAREVRALTGAGPGDLVVDVGSNDGTLLDAFRAQGFRVAGIEPTLTAELALAKGIPTVMRYFDRAAVDAVVGEHGRARVVTATNVFAHILDVHTVLDDVEALLAPGGVFVTESHSLVDLVETLQYDTIYHEHVRYYSLTSIEWLLRSHGLRTFHVTRIPTHGGSIRVYATRADTPPTDPTVAAMLALEAAAGLDGDSWVEPFRRRVARSKADLYGVLGPIVGRGERVYGVGAPSRASTVVNYVGLDETIVPCVLEVAGSKKVGKYMPGTSIPVLDEAKLYEDQPEYALLLSWHIGDELAANLRRRGYEGSFIVPLPAPRILA